jgi:hypothetical protein
MIRNIWKHCTPFCVSKYYFTLMLITAEMMRPAWSLTVGQRGGLETSADNYQLMLRDNSKERRPQLTVLFSHGKQKFKVHRP